MVEGGSEGGRGVEGDGGGYAAGVRDLAPACQRLLALRAGSLGSGLAEAGPRGRDHGARYADDAVLGFENRDEAESLRRELQERLRKVGLELHSEKTRMVECGRYAASNRKRRRESKPETFDFLGFTQAKLQEVRQKLGQRMHDAVPETGKGLRSVVRGYFNYHAVPGNGKRLQAFRDAVTR